MKLELVSFAICPFVQRSVIALKEKGVEFQITYIELDQPPAWFKAVSPLGKVPLLKLDHEVLFESAIINEYLDESYPPRLHPDDPLQRARHRGWIEFGSNMLFEQFQLASAQDEDAFQQAWETLGGSFARLEQAVSPGPYFSGEHFSLVDAAYAPFFMRFALLAQHNDRLPDLLPTRLQHWSEALLARPSVKASVREDFEPLFLEFFRRKHAYLLANREA